MGFKIVEFKGAETSKIKRAWEKAFVPEGTDKEKFHMECMRWHVFSYGVQPCEEKEKAINSFKEVLKGELYIFFQHNKNAYLIEDAVKFSYEDIEKFQIDFETSDVYVTDSEFKWTFVKTHENGWIGPYFSRSSEVVGIETSDEFDQYEDWEDDYHFYSKGDWKNLIEYREYMVKNNPNDYADRWRLGEAYVLNDDYEKALQYLAMLHKEEPEDINVHYIILDALFGLNKNENDFDWLVKPEVLKLNQQCADICYNMIKNKRKPKEILDLYTDLLSYGYLNFKKEELLQMLVKDERFVIKGNRKSISDVEVSVNRKDLLNSSI